MTVLDQAIIKAYLRQGGLPEGETSEAEGPGETETDGLENAREPTPHLASRSCRRPGPAGPLKSSTVPLDALGLTATEMSVEVPVGAGNGESPVRCRIDSEVAREERPDRRSSRPRPVEATPVESFEPMLRIDAISWSRPSRRLRRVAARQIERITDAVRARSQAGTPFIGVVGDSPGAGCTTVLLAVALRLGELGHKTLVVDGDVASPSLPEHLALANEAGWRDVVLGGVSLEDAVTQSESECVALLPYCRPDSKAEPSEPSARAMKELLDRIGAHYDVVLVDLGSALTSTGREATVAGMLGGRLNAALIVHNVQATSPHRLAMLQQDLQQRGIEKVGIVENFVDE